MQYFVNGVNIELSASSRAKCRKCREKIVMNELRLRYNDSDYYGSPKFYCKECSMKIIDNIQKKLDKIFDKLVKGIV